jgi:hypothetical protein
VSHDWQQVTTQWVEDGLIESSQQQPLLERLEGLPRGSRLSVGPMVTALVPPASVLLVGSCIALLLAAGFDEHLALNLTFSVSGALCLVLGVPLRLVERVRPLGRGLLCSAVLLSTTAVISYAFQWSSFSHLLWLALAPAGLGWLVGWLDGSRSLTATGALMTAVVLTTNHLGFGQASALPWLTLPVLALLTMQRPWGPPRATVSQLGAPAMVWVGVVRLLWEDRHTHDWLRTLGIDDPQYFELLSLVLIYGLAVLVIGLVGRSAWALVPGVAIVAIATVSLAFTLGSFVGGALALALVGFGLLALGFLLWLGSSLATATPRAAAT